MVRLGTGDHNNIKNLQSKLWKSAEEGWGGFALRTTYDNSEITKNISVPTYDKNTYHSSKKVVLINKKWVHTVLIFISQSIINFKNHGSYKNACEKAPYKYSYTLFSIRIWAGIMTLKCSWFLGIIYNMKRLKWS